jgi:PAS domain S-box-containing protein
MKSDTKISKKAGSALKEEPLTADPLGGVRSQLQSLLQAFPDIVYFKDVRGRNLVVNKAFEEMAGAPAEDIIGRTDDELLPPDLAAKCRESDERAIRGRAPVRFEEKSVGNDGQPRAYETIKAPLFDGRDKVVGLVGVSRDITQRKKVEEALHQLVREKEILLKETHHRVKNNMQIISSILNLQAKSIKDPVALEGLKMCQSRIRSMSLIHEKLYRSRDISRIDFGEYIRSLAAALLHSCQIDPARVKLRFETDEVLLDMNTAIPCGLIVNELVLNALKHAFPRRKAGEVRIALARNESGDCVLTVSDTGVGFPKNLDFRRTDSLGLQLVNLLVEQIGGTIRMRRAGGTKFEIAFPERKDNTAKNG